MTPGRARTMALGMLTALGLTGGTAAFADEFDQPIPDGAELFATHCANCHGRFGEGDGIITPSLAVVLQDLRYLSHRNNGEFPREFIIDIIDGRAVRAAHGPVGMPVWGAELARDAPFGEAVEARVNTSIERLADFLERIQILPAE